MSRFFTIATVAAALALGPALASTTAHAKGNPKNNEQNAMMDLLDLQLLFLEDQHPPVRVFVSVAAMNGMAVGNSGQGALGGDAHCQAFADAVPLGGTWMAWLSDSTTSPDARFTRDNPYELLDGRRIADSYADLIDCTEGAGFNECLDAVIDLDELGGTSGGQSVWTGTAPDGKAGVSTVANCNGWTAGTISDRGRTGLNSALDGEWTSRTNPTCNASLPLYCFEQ